MPKCYSNVLQHVIKDRSKTFGLEVSDNGTVVSDNEHLKGCERGNNGGGRIVFCVLYVFDFGVGKFRPTSRRLPKWPCMGKRIGAFTLSQPINSRPFGSERPQGAKPVNRLLYAGSPLRGEALSGQG